MKSKRNKRQYGFTLLELSFVLIIIGVTMVPLLQAVDRFFEQRKVEYTKLTVEAATGMIVEYRANGVYTGMPLNASYVYPCPARRDVPTTHSEFGVSINCTAAGLAALGLNAPGDCAQGVCIADSGEDRDGVGGNDWVIIGGFPVESIRIGAAQGRLEFRTPDKYSTRMDLDGWNNQFTYAVSYNLTQPNSLENFWYGVIEALDEFGNPTGGITNDAHFTVLSHGPDGKGAYNSNGLVGVPCGSSSTNDDENCDNDATFIQALGAYKASGANHYDDYVKLSKETSLSIWEEIQDGGRDQTYFAPSGNLGINEDTTPPDVAISINGTLRVNNNILADRICDEPELNPDGSANANANCFDVDIITGTNECGEDEALKGIWSGTTHCEKIKFEVSGTGKLEAKDCSGAAFGYVRGFKTNGEVICY